MRKISTFLIKSFELKPEEVKIFLLLFFHSFFLGWFIAFYFVPANTVFIKHFGSEHLPIAYIASGIAGYLSTSIYSALQKKVPSRTLFLGALCFMLLISILARVGHTFISEKWLSFFVFIWAWPFISLVGIESGGLSLHFLNLIQVKRLFGLFNMGGVFSAILSYLAIPVLTPVLGHSYDLLFVGIAGLIISIVILVIMYRKYHDKTPADSLRVKSENKTSFKHLFKQRYFTLIFVSATLSMTMIYITDFGFLSSVKINVPADSIQSYLSLVYGGLKIGELIISMFSSRILSKYGVRLGLTILPLAATFFMVGAASVGLILGATSLLFLVFMTLNKSFERILRRGLDDPAFNILYQPLPSSEKMAVQTKVGLVMQVSISIAGLFLLGVNSLLVSDSGFKLHLFPLFFLPILIAWVFVSRNLYASYKAKIRQILADISKDKKRDTAKYLYGAEALKKNLKKFNKNVVNLSVTILSETNPRMLEPYAASLLEETDTTLRKSILRNVEPTWRQRLYEVVDHIWNTTTDPKEKKHSERARENLDYIQIKNDTDEVIKNAMQMQTIKDKLRVIKYILKGRIDADEKIILNLLDDKDKIIKSSAINLSGRLKSQVLLNKLVELIQSSQYHHIAGNVLLDIGDRCLPELDKYFEQNVPVPVLLRVIELYAKIGSYPAKILLLSHIDYPNREVQLAVIWALYFCRFQAEGKEIPIIKHKLEQVVENILWIFATINDIEEEKNTLKLFLALDQERERNFEILFQLLSFLYEPRIITLIQKNIIGKNTIFALEIIDNFISQEIKELIVPLFDDISPAQRIKKLNNIFPQRRMQFAERLKDIIVRDYNKINPWTITKAIELLGRLHKSHVSKRSKTNPIRDYRDIEVWTRERVLDMLDKIRRSEMPDEIFVSLYHTDELVFSTAAKIIHEENPIKCFDYLINMSPEKQLLMSVLSNNGIILSDKVRLIKRHPQFFNVPEHLLVKLAKLIRIREVRKNEEILIENNDESEEIIILLKGALVYNKDLDDQSYYFKYDMIIRGLNIDTNARSLIAKKDTFLLLINRYDYFNLLVTETEIVRHIISETGDDDEKEIGE